MKISANVGRSSAQLTVNLSQTISSPCYLKNNSEFHRGRTFSVLQTTQCQSPLSLIRPEAAGGTRTRDQSWKEILDCKRIRKACRLTRANRTTTESLMWGGQGLRPGEHWMWGSRFGWPQTGCENQNNNNDNKYSFIISLYESTCYISCFIHVCIMSSKFTNFLKTEGICIVQRLVEVFRLTRLSSR